MGEPYRLLQSSFATGVISEEVAARVDLQKYQMAVLKADNVCIRPYGSMYKRMGTIFCGEVKEGPCVLKRFNHSETDYMLEMGEGYIRSWYMGEYTGVELETPFTQGDYPYLRFTQSADVLYVATGRLPVKTIGRYSHTEWKFEDAEISMPPFMPINADKDNRMIPSDVEGNITLTTEKDVFDPKLKDAYVKIEHYMPEKVQTFKGTNPSFASSSVPTNSEGGNFSCTLTVSGEWTGTVSIQGTQWGTTDWITLQSFTENGTYTYSGGGIIYVRVYGKLTSGNIVAAISSAGSAKVSASIQASDPIMCGAGWRVKTSGTWGGFIKIEQSFDKITWTDYRTYTSNSDFNASDNGVVDEIIYLRVWSSVTSGSATTELTILPYTHKGVVKLTSITDGKNAGAEVIDVLGKAEATADWYISCWNDLYGYPHCVSFFQDRLTFAKTYRQTNRVWFSKTADYPNFGTEK